MSKFKDDRVAYLEEVDDDASSTMEGTNRTYAYSSNASPHKERPNTGKSRHPSESSGSMSPADSDATTRSNKKSKEREMKEARRQKQKDADRDAAERDRRREKQRRARDEQDAAERHAKAKHEARAEREARALRKQRPSPLKQSQTQPVVQQYKRGHVDDSSYYGVVKQPAASSSRPRAQTRPQSYYAGQQPPRPPITNMGWHQAQPAPGSFAVGTFPPPYGGPPPHHQAGPPPSPSAMRGYFDAPAGSHQSNHLKSRFDMGRPSSAMGFSPTPSPMSYPRDYEDEAPTRVSRRPSTSRTKRQTDDRKRMPPPEFIPTRPQSAAVPQTPFRPPPGPRPPSRHNTQSRAAPVHRRSVGFADLPGYEDDDFRGDTELFHDMSPDPSHDQRRMAVARSHRRSGGFDNGFDIEPAGSRAKRASMYGTGALGTGGVSLEGEDKYLDAMRYQEDVGGAQLPLTAETLRKATRPRGATSSRSTRSSESRDESEFRHSGTTGITRSSSNHTDDVTIKLSGGGVVRVSGAEIECADGGEITFSSRPSGSRSGSDRASTIYQIEDSRSRMERKALPHRARAPSQSDSQSRGYAPYAPYEPTLAANNFF